MKKIVITLGLIIWAVVAGMSLWQVSIISQSLKKVGGGTAANSSPTFVVASSTVFTLTTSSQRLLASSTPTRRIGALIQPTLCTAANNNLIYMRADADKVATAATGIAAFGSTTLAFEDYPGIPVPQGSVQGITAAGTCTVLVTEWRSQY